jgi:hypothetical protein
MVDYVDAPVFGHGAVLRAVVWGHSDMPVAHQPSEAIISCAEFALP